MSELRPWQKNIHDVIYEADTPLGKSFDVGLLIAIVLSVIAVILESLEYINANFQVQLRIIEWFFTVIFTIEYVLRIASIKRPRKYIFSFYGLVDLLSILPAYLGLIIGGTHYLAVIRSLRLLRVFRVLKLIHFLGEARVLFNGLKASLPKITVFLGAVFTAAVIMGTLMFIIEGPEHGFNSIPRGIYWSIVTLTTVGYGDLTPQTIPGQILASMLMICGYGIIAVPAGIVSVEIAAASKGEHFHFYSCPSCSSEGLVAGSKYCRFCGESLVEHA